jgi:hypothetical protein
MTRSRDTASIIPTVDAKGDLLVGTADNTVDNLSPGTNGQVLTANSATTTGLQWTTPAFTGNFVINGAFDIWQRGTSFNATSTSFYSADRWENFRAGFAAGMDISRQAGSQDAGTQYAARVQRASGNASTATMFFAQGLETINSIPFAGKTVTLSFYARKGANYSQASSLLDASIVTGTGVDQSHRAGYTNYTNAAIQSMLLTTSWQRFSVTGTIASNATQVSMMLNHVPSGTAGANDWYEVTGVQLEAGAVATPFKRNAPSIQAELAACQRYYKNLIRQNGVASPWGVSSLAWTPTATSIEWYVDASSMRSAPLLDISSAGHFIEQRVGATPSSNAYVTTMWPHSGLVNLSFAVSGMVAGGATTLRANSGSAILALNAEL